MSTAHHIDNRTPSDVIEYLEARIEALKRRIEELEGQQAACTCREDEVARAMGRRVS